MDIDATKTPRTHAAWKKAYDIQELAKFMVELSQQLEVELNTAIVNEAFAENKVYTLEKQLKQANERIKQRDEWNERLDERIDRLEEKIIFLSEIRQEAGVQDANLREKLSVANERIKRLEEMYEGEIGENEQFLGSNLKGLLIREINECNKIIRQQQLLDEENLMLKNRIKRLEEALSWYESKVEDCNRYGSEGDAARDALAKDYGRRAKEAKL